MTNRRILPYPADDHEHHDDFNDLGLNADLDMLSRAVVDRRRVLALGGAGIATLIGGSLGLASAATRPAAACVPVIPFETAGPYPADGSTASGQTQNVLSRSGIVRRDLRTSLGTNNKAQGVPLTLKMTLVNVNGGCAPPWLGMRCTPGTAPRTGSTACTAPAWWARITCVACRPPAGTAR